MDQSKNQKIIFVHLLNDYSGSPLVLSNVIKGLQEKGCNCELITCAGTDGFLSNIEGVKYHFFKYRWHPYKYFRLLLFLWSQLILFFKILKFRNEDVNIYINTLLPFGAAIAGRLTGKRVTYHLHEVSIRPLLLKFFLRWIAKISSDQNIYVSNYLKETEGFPGVEGTTIYNALSSFFTDNADNLLQKTNKNSAFTVLMLCSLKDYKGVKEFVKIAEQLQDIQFELVINASPSAIEGYFSNLPKPLNLSIFSNQTNVHPFYQKAHIVMNLSHPEQWIETFGMTLLEGMYYGLPCIAPPIGGPAEIIEDKKDGFLVDQRNIDKIVTCIRCLQADQELYKFVSKNAKKKSLQFNYSKMVSQIHNLM
jgi:glycosyltransferase involved in cell wall biosynthesis